jgi:hypothetical protein
MAHVLGIPSPKEDIDGSMVRDVYYEEKDLFISFINKYVCKGTLKQILWVESYH